MSSMPRLTDKATIDTKAQTDGVSAAPWLGALVRLVENPARILA